MRVPSVRAGLLQFASPALSAPPLPAPAAVDAEVSRVIDGEPTRAAGDSHSCVGLTAAILSNRSDELSARGGGMDDAREGRGRGAGR